MLSPSLHRSLLSAHRAEPPVIADVAEVVRRCRPYGPIRSQQHYPQLGRWGGADSPSPIFSAHVLYLCQPIAISLSRSISFSLERSLSNTGPGGCTSRVGPRGSHVPSLLLDKFIGIATGPRPPPRGMMMAMLVRIMMTSMVMLIMLMQMMMTMMLIMVMLCGVG